MGVVKILSLDGGGTKGFFQMHFLNLLEKRLKRPLRDVFQYIGGTSIGGINAVFLTHPLKWFGYRNDFFIQEMLDSELPETLLKVFFEGPPLWFKSIGLFHARYSYQMDVIDAALRDHIVGNEAYGEGITSQQARCMVFAHNAGNDKVKVFKSWKHSEYYLYTVVRSTSAAPVFFTPVCIDEDVFVDGGLAGANNPTPFILYEAKLYNPHDEYVILSLGTGNYDLKFTCDSVEKGSIKEWASNFVTLILNSSDRSFEYLCGRHEYEGEEYESEEKNLSHNGGHLGYYYCPPNLTFRFRPGLNTGIDEISKEFLEKAKNIAYQIFEEAPELIDKLVMALNK